MGLKGALGRLARSGPIPVFAVTAADAIDSVRDLGLRHEVEIVATPRHANVLLVAGRFGEGPITGLSQIHDQLPLPRLTVRWNGEELGEIPDARVVAGGDDELVSELLALDAEILTGSFASESPLLPDVDAVEWRGVGPYGHGGTGMTGGTPFGRPLAERAPDRDGLELDQLPVRIGPWIGALPVGLEMHVKLQGDLIQEVEVAPAVVAMSPTGLFDRALDVATPVKLLEVERARHHLRWLADVLAIQGLSGMGRRALRLARDLSPSDIFEVERFLTAVRKSGVIKLVVGRISGGIVVPGGIGMGPVGRAAGSVDDLRLDDRSYQQIDFQPIVDQTGDTAARWNLRMAEIVQSLDLAARAGERSAFGSGYVEGPRGRIVKSQPPAFASLLEALPTLLTGLEWGDAVSVLWSLDLDAFAPGRVLSPAGSET